MFPKRVCVCNHYDGSLCFILTSLQDSALLIKGPGVELLNLIILEIREQSNLWWGKLLDAKSNSYIINN